MKVRSLVLIALGFGLRAYAQQPAGAVMDAALAREYEIGGITVSGTTTVDVNGLELGVAGIKGFGGGFLGRSASDFGEPEMRAFAGHSIDTAARLERCLTVLNGDVRIVLLHYSPVPDTLVGEPPELFPFLGSYLLAEAIDRALPDLVIHGHAHRGTERGVTPGGVRVRNVALPVLGAPFRVYELSAGSHGRPL